MVVRKSKTVKRTVKRTPMTAATRQNLKTVLKRSPVARRKRRSPRRSQPRALVRSSPRRSPRRSPVAKRSKRRLSEWNKFTSKKYADVALTKRNPNIGNISRALSKLYRKT